MLYACSILYKTRLPMILVFNKTDVKDASFAKEWMTDYDAFQAAVQAEASRSDAGDVPAGSGYMSSLVDSMSLMLEEFYAHLRVVAVSSMTGFGVNDFFAAVAEKADEFRRDYQPDLDRRRQERDEQKMKMREKELEKLMKGISMEPKAKVSKDDVVDNDGSGEGSDEMDEDDDDDDDGPDADYDREGLQARYAAALASETEGSLGADASFAKYLHSQRQQQ